MHELDGSMDRLVGKYGVRMGLDWMGAITGNLGLDNIWDGWVREGECRPGFR